MSNLKKKRVKSREQDPIERGKNFKEVSLGYGEEEAIEEANRCLGCKNPKCVEGCPVSVNIPSFISFIKKGDFSASFEELSKYNALPAVCGRVCPQESQCEGKCVLGIKGEPLAIGQLERFIADFARNNKLSSLKKSEKILEKVAVIGSGPAGLTCAGELAKLGYRVTIFEALHESGGVLVYGIPEFRLPKKDVVKYEIEEIKKLGVKIENNVVVGKTVDIDELIENEGFKAVFIGSGAGLPKFMGIKGENANGVFSANEVLTRVNLMKAFKNESHTPLNLGKKVAVVGGGDTACEEAVYLAGLASKVYLIVRKPFLRASKIMQERVMNHEKIEVLFEHNAVGLFGDNGVEGVNLVKRWGEPDEERYNLPIDGFFLAIGHQPNTEIFKEYIDTDEVGYIITDGDSPRTKVPGVFAAGDVADPHYRQAITAAGSGCKAALEAERYLSSKGLV